MGDNPFDEPTTTNQRLLNSSGNRSYSGGSGGAYGGSGAGGGNGGSGGFNKKEVFGDTYVEEGSNEAPPELQFQTFQHSSQPTNRGTMRNSAGGSNTSNQGSAVIQPEQSTVVDFEEDHSDKQPLSGGEGNPPGDNVPTAEVPPDTTNARFWTIQYYRPLFDVDTAQVLQRIFRSLTPFRFGFIETARTNPDFYGPFWIATTLVFVMAIFGNLSAIIEFYIHSSNYHGPTLSASSTDNQVAEFKPNFYMIIVGSCVFYGYTIIVPLCLWGVFKYLHVPVKLLELICIYGYALFIFIPVSLLCVIPTPHDLLQWVLTLFAAGWSGFFLFSNLLVTVKDIALKRGLVTLIVVGALHVGLGLTYKLYFFKNAYDDRIYTQTIHNQTSNM